EGDGPAVDVELVVRDAEMTGGGDDLGGERFIDLHQVDVVDGHARPAQRLAARLDGPQAHDLGVEGRYPAGDDAGHGTDPEVPGLGVAHHDHGGGAVVERAAVAGRHGAVWAEGVLERGELRQR